MYALVKKILNGICRILVLPLALPCRLEEKLSPHSEIVFGTCSHLFALLPGLPGIFLRRAFYSLTLTGCSLNCSIGFGSLFTHRDAVVRDHVYLGAYTIVGSALIGEKTYIGSRVSITSGKDLHIRDDRGGWTPFDPKRIVQVRIGPNVWIGEGAIVMADIGEGTLVGAGSVISSSVRRNVVVAGNPARFIRHLEN